MRKSAGAAASVLRASDTSDSALHAQTSMLTQNTASLVSEMVLDRTGSSAIRDLKEKYEERLPTVDEAAVETEKRTAYPEAELLAAHGNRAQQEADESMFKITQQNSSQYSQVRNSMISSKKNHEGVRERESERKTPSEPRTDGKERKDARSVSPEMTTTGKANFFKWNNNDLMNFTSSSVTDGARSQRGPSSSSGLQRVRPGAQVKPMDGKPPAEPKQ